MTFFSHEAESVEIIDLLKSTFLQFSRAFDKVFKTSSEMRTFQNKKNQNSSLTKEAEILIAISKFFSNNPKK